MSLFENTTHRRNLTISSTKTSYVYKMVKIYVRDYFLIASFRSSDGFEYPFWKQNRKIGLKKQGEQTVSSIKPNFRVISGTPFVPI